MKKIIPFLFFLWIYQSADGQLLYQIKGGSTTSYLYGTIHLMPEEDFAIQKNLLSAFNSCSMLAMEVDLNMDLSTKLKMATEALLPEGKTLKDYLNSRDYIRLKAYCLDTLHFSEKKFEKYSRMKPFFFSSVLLEKELDEVRSYELEFNEMAKKSKKTTMGLESIEVQLQTVNTIGIEDQAKMLMEGLGQELLFDEMVKAYKAEDIEMLYDKIIQESASFPNFVDNFLNKRNTSWIPVIENQIKKEATFIAVGAGHLSGNKGVLQLLKDKGYEISPIPLN